MHQQTQDQVIDRLKADYKFKPSQDGRYLRDGVCPQCSKKELFTNIASPYVIKCGRENHCGYTEDVRDLYPELFARWEERYPTTAENPKNAVNAYLEEGRGFELRRCGTYSQENYYNPTKNQGSITIRFAVADGWWERLLDPKDDMPKARMMYGWSSSGNWWSASDSLHTAKEIWITEGIFDAIALSHHGIKAVSCLSCNNYPAKALAQLKEYCNEKRTALPKLIWAFDNDNAGRNYTEKFYDKATSEGWSCGAAQPSKNIGVKIDWNDHHKRGKLTAHDQDNYRYFGNLFIADSKQDKALLIYNQENRTSFPFEFKNRLYWAKIDSEKASKEQAESTPKDFPPEATEDEKKQYLEDIRLDALSNNLTVTEIANCYPTPLYVQKNETTDESWFFLRCALPNGKPTKGTFTSAHLNTAADFKKRLMHVTGGHMYTGSSAQLEYYLKPQLEDIKKVETVDYIGYIPSHKMYIFGDIAVKANKTYKLNDDEYFEIDRRTNIKTLLNLHGLKITPTKVQNQSYGWIKEIVDGWGIKSIITTTTIVGSLFAQQIRAADKSYPFLEVVGDPGAGKSTLISFIWKLLGRENHEGIDPNKGSKIGLLRHFCQVSNWPIVLIESDRETNTNKTQQFQWDELKNLYDGGTIRTTGNKNNGNDTREPLFMGTIVVSQNKPVHSSPAIMSRIVHQFYTVDAQTKESENAARRLERMSSDDVSHIAINLMQEAETILETYSTVRQKTADDLRDIKHGIKSFRVIHNHAQIFAIYFAIATHVLPELLQYKSAIYQEILTMAIERDKTLLSEHRLVVQFWEIYELLQYSKVYKGEHNLLNHHRKPDLIGINISQFYQLAKANNYEIAPQIDMLEALQTSRHYKFIASNKSINSALTEKSTRCCIFTKPKVSITTEE